MKLMKWLKAHPATLKDVAVSTCLLGASAGIVFGISAATFKINYMPLDSAEARLAAVKSANYLSEKISSKWNMEDAKDENGNIKIPCPTIEGSGPWGQSPSKAWNTGDGFKWWHALHPNAKDGSEPWSKAKDCEPNVDEGDNISDAAIKARHEIVSMVIDGATHSTMDRSFNQSLYEGLVDYIHNKRLDHYDAENLDDGVGKNTAYSFKPAQDNTTEFENIYLSTIHNKTVVGLAGFNHATPLNSLMVHNTLSDGSTDPLATGPDAKTNEELDSTCFILLDSNIANNQNIASVQFRADQPGFLTGLATCQYFYNNLDLYHDNYQDLEVAAFGGVQIPTVLIYMGGYQRGIELFNYAVLGSILKNGPAYYYDHKKAEDKWAHLGEKFKNLVEHSKYKDELTKISSSAQFQEQYRQKLYDEFSVKMIKLGDIGTHFSGTFAAGDAIGITKQYLNRGASAIIAVAGPQSLDVAQEIKNQNSKCIVIGVDTAMEAGDYQRYHSGCDETNRGNPNTNDKYMDQTVDKNGNRPSEANGIIKFSAIKDIKRVTNTITRLSLQGYGWDVNDQGTLDKEMPDPVYSICGPGYQTCGNIKNGLISISWDGFYPLMQALECIEFKLASGAIHPFSEVWQEATDSYITHIGDDAWKKLDAKYRDNIKNLDIVKTFDKTSEIGKALYENYNHTIAILAEAFSSNEGRITFDRTMTLDRIAETDEWRMLEEGETIDRTILSWLDTNMYVIS